MSVLNILRTGARRTISVLKQFIAHPAVKLARDAILEHYQKLRVMYRRHAHRRYWLSYQLARDRELLIVMQELKRSWKVRKRPYFPPAHMLLQSGISFRSLLVTRCLRRVWTLFLPSACLYAILGTAFAAMFCLIARAEFLGPGELRALGTLAGVLTSVIAIGIPLVATYGTFRKGEGYAQKYLFATTRLGTLAALSAGAAVLAILGAILQGPPLLLGIVAGVAAASVLALTATVLEIVHYASRPFFAWAATAHAASTALLGAFLANTYLNMFNRKHESLLDGHCAKLDNVHGPGEYLARHMRADHGEVASEEVLVGCKYFIERQYLDFDLRSLLELDLLAGKSRSEFWLTPHFFSQVEEGKTACIGMWSPAPAKSIAVDSAWISPRTDFCSGLKDLDVHQMEDAFLQTVSSTLGQHDRIGFRLHIRALSQALIRYGRIWNRATVEPHGRDADIQRRPGDRGNAGGQRDMPVEVKRWVLLYRRFLLQVLYHEPTVDRTPVAAIARFTKCLQDELLDLFEKCVINRNLGTFEILTAVIPDLYEKLNEFCVSKKDTVPSESFREVWGIRARWGQTYARASFLRELAERDMPNAERWRFLLLLHRSASDWLRVALTPTADTRLAEELAGVLGHIAQADAEWRESHLHPEEAELLKTRHWALVGEMIQRAIGGEKGITSDMLGHLTPKELLPEEPSELLRFYADHKRVDELSKWFTDFGKLSDIEMGPLSGFGTGGARFVPQHEEKMRLAFCFLLTKLGGPAEPGPEALHIDLDALKKTMETLTDRRDLLDHRILPPWIKPWLENCDKARKTEDDEKVVNAEPDATRLSEFESDFWEAFVGALSFLDFLRNNRAYKVLDQASMGPFLTRIGKRQVIEPIGGVGYASNGDERGRRYARALDDLFVRDLLERLADKTPEGFEESTGLDSVLDAAADWLDSEHQGGQGVICVPWHLHLTGELDDNERFLPQWRDPSAVRGFAGRYRGFLVRQYSTDPKEDIFIALSLANWHPLGLRSSVIEGGGWGEIEIRDWKAEELKKARAEDPESFDETALRQDCMLELLLHIEFELGKAEDHARAFRLVDST